MSQHGQFILCVDDDSDDLYLLQEAIREVDPGMEIVQFNNGIDALKYLKEAKAEHDLPCVAVLDINMPIMDGKETLNRIKSDPMLSHVHVVVLTTSSSKNDKGELLACSGVETFFPSIASNSLISETIASPRDRKYCAIRSSKMPHIRLK